MRTRYASGWEWILTRALSEVPDNIIRAIASLMWAAPKCTIEELGWLREALIVWYRVPEDELEASHTYVDAEIAQNLGMNFPSEESVAAVIMRVRGPEPEGEMVTIDLEDDSWIQK
mgnify:CR=1 FL=1